MALHVYEICVIVRSLKLHLSYAPHSNLYLMFMSANKKENKNQPETDERS